MAEEIVVEAVMGEDFTGMRIRGTGKSLDELAQALIRADSEEAGRVEVKIGHLNFQIVRTIPKEELQPKVRALAHTYDRKHDVEFDATPWFALASDDAIAALVECGFGHDYPSDRVAEESGEHAPQLKCIFDHIGPNNGFECIVDEDEAKAWIKQHRPYLVTWDTSNDSPAREVPARDLLLGRIDRFVEVCLGDGKWRSLNYADETQLDAPTVWLHLAEDPFLVDVQANLMVTVRDDPSRKCEHGRWKDVPGETCGCWDGA